MKCRFFLPPLLGVLVIAARAALPTPDPDNGAIILPPGFRAVVFADNLVAHRHDNLRFLAVAPNGDVYAKTARGGIFALRDTNGDGRADVIKEFGSGGGTGIAVHDGWLYGSTNGAVYRYRLTPGELVPSGEPETIVSGLPDGHQHNAKAFAFDSEGRLLVEVGSPYNVYSDGDRRLGAKGLDATEFLKTHGGYWRFDANKPGQTEADGFHLSTGQRHSLSIAWNPVSQHFFMVMMGRDNLNTVDPTDYDELDNAYRVSEEMHMLHPGVNIGWPYTYYDPIKKARMVAPEFGGDNRKRAEPGKYDRPIIAFPAHWAPLQMTFYFSHQFPAHYYGGAFIAFHGSWNRAPLPQAGYKIVFVPFDDKGMPTGEYETFADDFAGRRVFTNTNDARFRPGGVAVGPDGSLYVGDTEKGRIWRIFYTGETGPAAGGARGLTTVESPAGGALADHSRGAQLYALSCAACHMADGSGVPNMQPPLAGSPVVAGDTSRLINVLLRGPAAVLPSDRLQYQNTMPAFGSVMNDADLAAIISYVRRTFAHGAPPVTPAQVAAVRDAK